MPGEGYKLTDPDFVQAVTGRAPEPLALATSEAIMPVIRNNPAISLAEAFVPEADVIGTHDDGRTYLIAAAGVPVAMPEAQRLGLVKSSPSIGPSEIKSELEAPSGPSVPEADTAPSDGEPGLSAEDAAEADSLGVDPIEGESSSTPTRRRSAR